MEKKNRYIVTLRWHVETDEELVPGAKETDEKILDILRHKADGRSACANCPTRNQEGVGILNYHEFIGDKPVYMSAEKITEKQNQVLESE